MATKEDGQERIRSSWMGKVYGISVRSIYGLGSWSDWKENMYSVICLKKSTIAFRYGMLRDGDLK